MGTESFHYIAIYLFKQVHGPVGAPVDLADHPAHYKIVVDVRPHKLVQNVLSEVQQGDPAIFNIVEPLFVIAIV